MSRNAKKSSNRARLLQQIIPTITEPLEKRLFLSSTKGPYAAIGNDLENLYNINQNLSARGVSVTSNWNALQAVNPFLNVNNGYVTIDAVAETSGDLLAADLVELGAINIAQDKRNLSASFPIGELADLAALPSLRFARASYSITNTGSVPSQADTAIRTSNARTTYGITGAGVKVGVLSDSFDTGPGSYAADITSGDLPSGVSVLQDFAGGTDEGRAMAQLIYDEAPGSTLAFATAFNGVTSFANNIKALRDAGCKVIVDDVSNLGEPFFQDGPIAQAVDNVTASGVAYFSSAGNSANRSYESNWRSGNVRANASIPSASGVTQFWGGTTFDFDPGAGVDDMNSFTLPNGGQMLVSFQWDQPFLSSGGAACANDIDIYVLNAAGTQIVGGSATDNVGGDAVEAFLFTNSTGATATFNLMACQYTAAGGPTPGFIKYIEFRGQASSVQFPYGASTVMGHANSATGAGVAAARYDATPAFGVTPPVVESFSSLGGTAIRFNTAGVAIAPVVRNQPMFTGVDGSDTTFFGQAYDATPAPNFFGTSAAAPVLAGVAALLLQKVPTATPAQINTAFANTAVDMSTGGFDFLTGAGLVRADNAIATFLGTVGGTTYEDRNGNSTFDGTDTGLASVTVWVDLDNNGAINGIEPSATSAIGGPYTIPNVPAGTYTIRSTTPSGYVAVQGSGGHAGTIVTASLTTTRNFGYFPTLFNGTGANESYYIRGGSSLFQLWVGATPPTSPTYSIAKSLLPAVTVSPSGGDDTLVIDYSLGDPIPTAGLTFTGGANTTTTGDTVELRGTGIADTFAIASAGVITHSGTTVNYGTLETLKVATGTLNASANLSGINLNVTGNVSAANLNSAQTLGTLTVTAAAIVNSASVTPSVIGIDATSIILNSGNLSVATNGTIRGVTKTKSLSITGTGYFNLRDNDLIVDYSGGSTSYSTINNYVKTGLTLLGGPGAGIGSTIVDLQTVPGTMLGVVDNGEVGGAITTLSGASAPAQSVLVKFTWFGDADLSGSVDGSDYALIDTGFGSNGTLTGWVFGNFDYGSSVDGSDYALIDTGLLSQTSVL